MAKVPLQKVRITGLRTRYKALMQHLHRSGLVHITQNDTLAEHSRIKPQEYFGVFDLARIESALHFLQPYRTVDTKLESFFSGGKLVMSEPEAQERLKVFSPQAEDTVKRTELAEENIVVAENEIRKVEKLLSYLEALKGFHETIEKKYDTASTRTWFLSLPESLYEDFVRTLAQQLHRADLQKFPLYNGSRVLRVTVHRGEVEEAQELIRTHGAQEAIFLRELEAWEGLTLSEVKKELEKQGAHYEKMKQEALAEASALAAHYDDLRILFDYNTWRKAKNDLQSGIYQSERVFAFEGWTVESTLPELKKWIKNTFVDEVVMEEITPEKDEEPPVLLQNGKVVSSFEPIVDMFGLPTLKEFDPTPFMAPFFFVFFGLCLSDVGYGLILTLFALVFLIKGKMGDEAKRGLRMLVLCGLATIAGGVITGGYFGITPDQAPGFLLNDSGQFIGQLINPLEGLGPVIFLSVAIGIGALHLLWGLMIDFAQRWVHGDKVGALCDPGAWMAFLVALAGWGLADMVGLPKDIMGKAALGTAVLLVLTQGRDQKNWFLKPIVGILGLYNITGYLSDLLSYSRVMALGMATGVVGFAMNMTAGILGDMVGIPVISTLVTIFVLLAGHSLNFALSVLGATIHTGRLQFIEFFGKFYAGGGKAFVPFARKNKHLFFTNKS